MNDMKMIRTTVNCYTEKEEREIIMKLIETGYQKVAYCMWTKIYHKGNNEIIINREWDLGR